jgi:hypothetical protein
MATQLAQATDTQQAVPTTPVQVEPVQAVPAGALDTTLLPGTVQPDTDMTITGCSSTPTLSSSAWWCC